MHTIDAIDNTGSAGPSRTRGQRRLGLLTAFVAAAMGASLIAAAPPAHASGLIWDTRGLISTPGDNDEVTLSYYQQGSSCVLAAAIAPTANETTDEDQIAGSLATVKTSGQHWAADSRDEVSDTDTVLTSSGSCPSPQSAGLTANSTSQVLSSAVGAAQQGVNPSTASNNAVVHANLSLPNWARDFLAEAAYLAVSVSLTGAIIVGAGTMAPAVAASPWFEAAAGCVGGAAGNTAYLAVLGQTNWKDVLSGGISGCLATAAETVAFSKIGQWLHGRVNVGGNPAQIGDNLATELSQQGSSGYASARSSASGSSVYEDALSVMADLP